MADNASQCQVLDQAHASLLTRIRCCRQAQHSIKLQYYIWWDDNSGLTLFNELLTACKRGVKVQLLLDDFQSRRVEKILRDLNRYENFEVKLFNPLKHRHLRWLNWLTDFRRLNRRMHNKAMLIDDELAIVGGRNVGDEYFGTHAGELFSDLDVLIQGDIVAEIEQDWRNYWDCDLAVAIDNVPGRSQTEAFIERWKRYQLGEHSQRLNQHVLNELPHSEEQPQKWTSVTGHWISDDPLKASLDRKPKRLVLHQLTRVIGKARKQLRLVSPYFVPTVNGVQELEMLRDNGVHIEVLTNSLAATDVPVVHAGYQRRRRRLLAAGVTLYELRPLSDTEDNKKVIPYFRRSATSLHAKTVVVDDELVFVGSFNFDPRSAQINTEAGLLIESTELASRMNELFEDELPLKTYEPRLNRFYKLFWVDRSQVPVKRFYKEPQAGRLRRLLVWITARLPIEHLL